MFKHTVTKVTSSMTKEQSADFDEAFKGFDKFFEKHGKDFGVSRQEGTSEEVEVYGSGKEDAINKANVFSANGFKLVSCKENTELGVWVAKLKK